MRRNERNDMLILDALEKNPRASALQLARMLRIARSSVISALVDRRSSLLRKGYVERAGPEFSITDEGMNYHDLLVTKARLELEQPPIRSARESRNYPLVVDLEDKNSNETLGFMVWLPVSLPRNWTHNYTYSSVDRGTTGVSTRKMLHRWLRRPVKIERLVGPQSYEGAWGPTNRDYLAYAIVATILAAVNQRRRLLITRTPYFNDIAVIRSSHLSDIPPDKFARGIRRLLGLRASPKPRDHQR